MRSNALTRVLAGCIAICPIEILPLLGRLKPEALTDLEARCYIQTMQLRLPELQEADLEGQTDISVKVAKDSNLIIQYLGWVILVKDVWQDASAAIRELQGLAITLDTIAGLRDWIQTCAEVSEWR
jgi:hypothetical protein